MGKLYDRFYELRKHCPKNWFMNKIGLVKFEEGGKNYAIFFARKRANRHTVIHCANNTIEWEQLPIFSRITGKAYGKREPMISIAPSNDDVRIFIVAGQPKSITGLDEGKFCSIRKYDESYVVVMTESDFKKLDINSDNEWNKIVITTSRASGLHNPVGI